MVFGLQTQPKSWLTGYTFWVNHYLEIVFSKISVVNPPLKDIHGLRVFDANIRRSSKCILHILSKEIVSLIDIFLFNVPRSFNMDDFPYEMLEELKDGKAESTKYNSVKLELNTPNTVLVFSNENPDKERMSKDRWVIYLIGVGVLLRTNGYKV